MRCLVYKLICLFVALSSVAASAQTVPDDPDILSGKLPCGLTYHIARCLRPAYKINFYLVQGSGSVVEEDDERGFSHFTEHMAFNGSRHFPGKGIVNTLERHDIKFGYDINAYTSHDFTVFNISSVDALDSGEMADTCLLMLKDISMDLTFADDAIEAERKIILREWEQGNGAAERIVTRMLPVLFGPSSRYSFRMPIGTPEVIANFNPERLRAFYRKWYQPQHQSIFVVGYVDPREIERKIREIWAHVRPVENPTVREWYAVEDYDEMKTAVIIDDEFPGSQLDFWFPIPIPPRDKRNTMEYFTESLSAQLAQVIIDNRLAEISNSPGSPFSNAKAELDQYYLADSRDAFRMFALYDFARRPQMLARLTEEAKRAAVHGVTPAEVEHALVSMRSIAGRFPVIYEEENNDARFERISELATTRNAVPSAAEMQRITLAFADTVTPAAANAFLRRFLRPDNLVAVMTERPSPDSPAPDSVALRSFIDSVWTNSQPEPPSLDDAFMRPLMPEIPEPGAIVISYGDSVFDARKYVFDNGVEVTACRSSVLADQVDFRAVRRGGMAVLVDSGYISAYYADAVGDIGGIGDFSSRDLNKKFQHTKISLSSIVAPYSEMIEGECALGEIEQLLQLVNLKMRGVRRDPEIFDLWLHNLKASFDDRTDDPDVIFYDSVRVALYGPAHPYLRGPNRADLDSLDYDRTLRLYQQRIANPAEWQYIITGNFKPDSIVPLLATYLGSLPAKPAKEQPHRIVQRRARPGVRDVRFSRRMVSPVTKAYLAYEIHRPYTMVDEMAMKALASVLEKEYLQRLRTDAGGTYGASVEHTSSELDGLHALVIRFDTDSALVDGLVAEARAVLARIASDGVDPEIFRAVADYQLNEEYISALQQHYPMEVLTHQALYHDTHRQDRIPASALLSPEALQELARALVDAPVQISVVMLPE